MACQMENQTKSRKNQCDYIFQVRTSQKKEHNLKLNRETLKVYLQVKFLRITFDSQLSFQKQFESGSLQYQVPSFKATSQKK